MFKFFALCVFAVVALAAAQPGIVAPLAAYSSPVVAAAPYTAAYTAGYAAPYTAGYAAPYTAAYSAYSAYPYASPYVAAPYAAGYSAYPYAASYLLRK